MSTIVPIETLSTSPTSTKSNSFTSILRKKTRTTKEVDDFIQNQPNQATLIDNETGLPILTYAVQVNDVYAVGRLLETSKVGKKYILHALDAAVGKLKADCVEVLLEHWGKFPDENLANDETKTQKSMDLEFDENKILQFKNFQPDEIMCHACIDSDLSPENSNGPVIIGMLFKSGFKITQKFEHPELSQNHIQTYKIDKSFNDRRILREGRCTDYHYTRYTHIKAKSNATYMILEHENGTIYDKADPTIFGNCIALVREVKYHKRKSALFDMEYGDLVVKIDKFMCKLVDKLHDDVELSYILHLDMTTVRHEDRNKIPLLKNCCTYELKELATSKRFQGVISYINDLHLAWLPKGAYKMLGPIALFLIGLFYPIYTLAYLFNPKSFLGKISHWPKIAFACQAVSEVAFAIFILSYTYFTKNYTAQIIYTSIMTVWVFARIMQEVMEFNRSKAYYYLREFWNLLDLVEICLLIVTVVARFIWLSGIPKTGVIQPCDSTLTISENPDCHYNLAAQVADGAFAFVPVFTTLRLLMMFRINRTIGILQISFTKMLAVDVLVWMVLILMILLGFGTSFFTFSSSVLYFYPQSECTDTIYRQGYT